MELKAKIEAIIYAAEEPITVEQIALLVKDIVLARDSVTDSEAAEAAAAEETSGAGAVEASTPGESTAVDADAASGTAVSEADEAEEDVNAEVKEVSEADAASVETAIETEPEPEQAAVAAPAQNMGKRLAHRQKQPGAPASR